MYILVVDDDPFANMLVKFVLDKEGYEVETADNPKGALQMIQKREPDLLLLDVKMPYLTGFEFSQQLRTDGFETPLIFMTAQDTIESKLEGFKIGADDYICKPYIHEELVARVHAVMRRVKNRDKVGNESLRGGHVELFPSDLKVSISGKEPMQLTHTEMQVLRILMSSAGHVVSRDTLLSKIWHDDENNSNIVDVYIRRLRVKIENNPYQPQHIVAVRGQGYKFVEK